MNTKRIVSLVLVFVLLLSTIPAVSAASANTETRGTVCTALSSQAKAYYKGSYTYDTLSSLEGGTTNCLTTVNSPLYQDLQDLMEDTMTDSVSYKALTNYWPKTDNSKFFYSNTGYGGTVSREHVWPKSHASFHQSGGGSDLHHLRPENSEVNSTRWNYTFGNVKDEISGCTTYTYSGKTVLWYSKSNYLCEIPDYVKGDVARIFLYVYVRWGERNLFQNDPNPKQASNDSGGNDGIKVIESLDTLLEWCHDDPVDTWEMKRNDTVQDVQGNRNVFIDYPELAWLLFGQEIPNDMSTPSGKAKTDGTSPSPTYTFTAKSSNTAYGTVRTSGSTVTATPKTGYAVSGYTVSPAGAATITRSGNVFTVSNLKSNCTITINFVAASTPTYTFTAKSSNTAYGTVHTSGSTVTVTPKTGYAVSGYTVSPAGAATVTRSGNVFTVSDLKSDCTITINFAEESSAGCTHPNRTTLTVKATCLSAGSEKVVCDDCGLVLSNNKLSKLGHDYQSKVTKPATTEKTGVETFTCTRCGDSYTQTLPVLSFSDLDRNGWYMHGVEFVLGEGLMYGIDSKHFDPEGDVTRAMLVTVLWRYAGQPEQGTSRFTDVPSGRYFSKAVAWAAESGIVYGVTETEFEPDGSITREQLAAILYRYAQKLGQDVSMRGSLDDFADRSIVSKYAADAMQWAVAKGIISGDPRGTARYLDPQGNATRAQVASILMRFLEA